jgi:sugar phosphate isomerase/epimerase
VSRAVSSTRLDERTRRADNQLLLLEDDRANEEQSMISRRNFIQASAAGALLSLSPDLGAKEESPPRAASDDATVWRTAFGLNGFMSSEAEFGNSFPIWEVLQFAEREGFDGIELVSGWPRPYPAPTAQESITALKSLYARYGLTIFSIQSDAGGAFRRSAAARRQWLVKFREQAQVASDLGCECIGLWPGGDLDGQTLEEARDRLIESLRMAARIVADLGLQASVEIEPPFVFHTMEDLIQIVDGVGHPQMKGMYDPSHFDVMNGGRGRPEELLLRLGAHRVGYVHLTDTDGTLFRGTSRHLPCGDGHVDIARSLEILRSGGFRGWIMVDAWMTPDPYRACRKGLSAIRAALAD